MKRQNREMGRARHVRSKAQETKKGAGIDNLKRQRLIIGKKKKTKSSIQNLTFASKFN